jgi:hypothetical protein
MTRRDAVRLLDEHPEIEVVVTDATCRATSRARALPAGRAAAARRPAGRHGLRPEPSPADVPPVLACFTSPTRAAN